MFCGSFITNLDKKGRLRFPAQIKDELDKSVIVKIGPDDCVEIHKSVHVLAGEDNPASIFEVKVRNGGRVKIPETFLKDSNSFYFGRKVRVVGKESYFVLWPWP